MEIFSKMERLKFGNYSLCVFNREDVDEVARVVGVLFSDPDTQRFFTVSDTDIEPYAFAQSMANVNETHRGIDCLIRDNGQNNIGLLTCELDNKWQSDVYWSIGLTIHPSYRNQGYATKILKDICMLLGRYNFEEVILDISEYDNYMERAAKSAGYKKREYRHNDGRVAFFDRSHQEIGLHNLWCRKLHDLCERDMLCNKALELARNKNYLGAIPIYQQALTKECTQESGWTDAQIFSNLGICYSATKHYQMAYQCLKKAQAMGLNNPTIQQELQWLHNNIGLG